VQEHLEREKDGMVCERQLAIQHSQEARNRFSNELELAIAGWQLAMNAEVAKAKEISHNLQEVKSQLSSTLMQQSLAGPNLMTASHQIHEHKKSCNISKVKNHHHLCQEMKDVLQTLKLQAFLKFVAKWRTYRWRTVSTLSHKQWNKYKNHKII
jgi:HPt (histidine-containing phosphotransfer) domain-containing protein